MEEEVEEDELDLLETTDDSRHRLLYYLYNINQLVDLRPVCPEIVHYLNYEQYCLSQDQERELYDICQRFSPLVFDSFCIINNDDLCQGVTHCIYPTQSIDIRQCDYTNFTVNGVRLTIHHVLAYKVKWMDRFYFSPIDILKRKVDSYKIVRKQSRICVPVVVSPVKRSARIIDLSLWLPSVSSQIGIHLFGLIYCIAFEVYTLDQYFGERRKYTFENVIFSTVGLCLELAGILFSSLLPKKYLYYSWIYMLYYITGIPFHALWWVVGVAIDCILLIAHIIHTVRGMFGLKKVKKAKREAELKELEQNRRRQLLEETIDNML